MESLLVEKEVLSLKTGLLLKSAITFDQTVGSCSNNYSGFWMPVLLVLPMEALLLEEEVLWRQTGITAEKCHKF
jgi:hypothetical protein